MSVDRTRVAWVLLVVAARVRLRWPHEPADASASDTEVARVRSSGLAAQALIANFVAGIFIIQDEPFTVGDWIEWDDHSGVVRDIQLRVTKLDTFDNQMVTVPNSDLANAAVINNVVNQQRRVSVDVGIGYDVDIGQARDAIIDEGTHVETYSRNRYPRAR